MTTNTLNITERTRIPISLVIVVITVTVWLIRLEARIDAHAQAQTQMTIQFDQERAERMENAKIVRRIDRRLSNIEGHLGLPSSETE